MPTPLPTSKHYPGDIDALLIQVEADWRAWLLTHDPAWRSLALARAAAPTFPVAHLPTSWGNEFVRAADGRVDRSRLHKRPTCENAQRFLARLKAVDPIRVIATVTRFHTTSYLTTLAPADEYFGPMDMSILEIENRLKHINFMLDYDYGNRESGEGANVAHAIVDMQKVYPRDRDLPMLHLLVLHDAPANERRAVAASRRADAQARSSRSNTRTARKPESSSAPSGSNRTASWIR